MTPVERLHTSRLDEYVQHNYDKVRATSEAEARRRIRPTGAVIQRMRTHRRVTYKKLYGARMTKRYREGTLHAQDDAAIMAFVLGKIDGELAAWQVADRHLTVATIGERHAPHAD